MELSLDDWRETSWLDLLQSAFITLAASTGKLNVTIWRPSVCLSLPSTHSRSSLIHCHFSLTVTHQGQHATRPAYISARQ